MSIGTSDLDRIGAALHGFEFFVEEFIDASCDRCLGFNFDLDTTDVSRTTHA